MEPGEEDEILEVPLEVAEHGEDVVIEYWLEVQAEYHAELQEEQDNLQECEGESELVDLFEAAMKEKY